MGGSPSKRIHIDSRRLRKAFFAHEKCLEKLEEAENSRKLLLFYATECLMKSAVLEDQRDRSATTALFSETGSEYFGKDGHDLARGLKHIRNIPKNRVGEPPTGFKLYPTKEEQPVKKIHQAWRYSIPIDHSDELKIVHWLNGIIDALGDYK